MLDRAGSHTLAHRLPARFGVWRERYPDPQTRRAWTIAYPDAFRDRVESWAAKRDLADAFVWAIIRKESGYNATIKSWANARGLMQLMPDTARQVAEKDGLSGFGLRDLLDPSTNIRLGTAYLAGLSESFDGHPALVAAGYNGGRGNINRWLDERGELPVDLWIEDIPYGQTRRYAKVVLANYWTYRWLYEDGSTPRIPFRFGD
jgi:soluble lytic murein transglycosylase